MLINESIYLTVKWKLKKICLWNKVSQVVCSKAVCQWIKKLFVIVTFHRKHSFTLCYLCSCLSNDSIAVLWFIIVEKVCGCNNKYNKCFFFFCFCFFFLLLSTLFYFLSEVKALAKQWKHRNDSLVSYLHKIRKANNSTKTCLAIKASIELQCQKVLFRDDPQV